ncbi:LysR family carnitine catabolism transcriptional activator [Variovorax boronicumulans]|uniref:LysR family carnitine catabolism transcriptional activator n=1 Tax=Variovorax boronicumulans TaxID=436515 RepID=A0AAW8CWU6_9BURK|nr:LysR family transcriptional regulator [Variovorax boronicumulans]MDP9894924.1 LysR family carnitine catabolism transcriptional activator [Variovorax boronicumulans]MDQ0054756.1 LysR family carnitine catabolism transcriptional activator [Variovorax boronicumulans]
MTRIKLRQLCCFLEVFQRKKIALAAEQLHMTQSAVSMSLKQLEESVGAPLFDRTTRSLVPTLAAIELAPVAERMLRDGRHMENMFRHAQARGGRLSVVTTPTLAQTLLPSLIAGFLAEHPEIRVDVIDVAPEHFAMTLASGQADIGFGFLGRDDTELKQHRVLEDQLCLVMPSTAPPVERDHVSWTGLQRIPVALTRPGYGIREIIDRTTLAGGISLQVSHEVGLLTTALGLTSQGITNTIAPRQIARLPFFSGLAVCRIRAPVIRRDISVVFQAHRTPSPATRRFLDYAVEYSRAANQGSLSRS